MFWVRYGQLAKKELKLFDVCLGMASMFDDDDAADGGIVVAASTSTPRAEAAGHRSATSSLGPRQNPMPNVPAATASSPADWYTDMQDGEEAPARRSSQFAGARALLGGTRGDGRDDKAKFMSNILAAQRARIVEKDDAQATRILAERKRDIGDPSLVHVDASVGVFRTPGYLAALQDRADARDDQAPPQGSDTDRSVFRRRGGAPPTAASAEGGGVGFPPARHQPVPTTNFATISMLLADEQEEESTLPVLTAVTADAGDDAMDVYVPRGVRFVEGSIAARDPTQSTTTSALTRQPATSLSASSPQALSAAIVAEPIAKGNEGNVVGAGGLATTPLPPRVVPTTDERRRKRMRQRLTATGLQVLRLIYLEHQAARDVEASRQ